MSRGNEEDAIEIVLAVISWPLEDLAHDAAQRLEFVRRVADDQRADTRTADDQHFVRERVQDRLEIAAGKGESAKHHDEQNNYTDSCEHECACFIPDFATRLAECATG
jgi:hypothetical protein